MNENNYKKVSEWFREKDIRLKVFNILYKILPYVIVVSYMISICYEVIKGDLNDKVKMIVVPMVTFGLCTIIRKVVNEKRPYVTLDINPLIKKDKEGDSFPSRHMVSAAVIAVAAFYVNIYFGIFTLVISILIGILRPIAGVHYIKDVVAGFMMGIIFGVLGFFIIG